MKSKGPRALSTVGVVDHTPTDLMYARRLIHPLTRTAIPGIYTVRPYLPKVPLRSAILDWSGTTIDPHSGAPIVAFIRLLKKYGIDIPGSQAVGKMGTHKMSHLKGLFDDPQVMAQWIANSKTKSPPTQEDFDQMFADFVPIQLEVLSDKTHTTLIPGVGPSIQTLRSKYGFKIGVTTGFTRKMTDVILPSVRAQGFVPDACVSADEVPRSRPFPDGCRANMIQLGTETPDEVMKAGDSQLDMEEGIRAGCVTVGIASYSPTIGQKMLVFREEAEKRKSHNPNPNDEWVEKWLQESREHLAESGPHFVVDTFEQIPILVGQIQSHFS